MPRTLADEIRQRRPFGSAAEEAHLNVVRTASVLSDAMEQLLRPAGVTLAQYNVLRILRGAEPDGLCRNALRDRLLTRMPDVTRLLDRMEEAGLVRRARETEDRRMVRTHLTAAGRALVDSLDAPILAAHGHRFGALDAAELRTLVDLLTRVRNAG